MFARRLDVFELCLPPGTLADVLPGPVPDQLSVFVGDDFDGVLQGQGDVGLVGGGEVG